MCKNATPKTIYLKEYSQPDYWIDRVDLRFELEPEKTRVISELHIRRRESLADNVPLVLNGEQLKLLSVAIDQRSLDASEYKVDNESLTIPHVPAEFVLRTEVQINPLSNTSLEGLYQSSGNFCTQCEAEGFRKITYYLDRPDVMAIFSTTIVADKKHYPVLLSNGNPVDKGELDNGRHWVKWQDPFKKPCYLFALVAGDLQCIEDQFTTMSGRDVTLQIFVEAHNIDKCDHAMASLKKSMQWDEQKYGREYDLDIYMIVAVDDFNMGAMENKGLNVFNSKYVLARPESATDVDYVGIEGVIGHEYFHNWSGNRVTCRDWFQLTLKEGLTVFRDQQFTADMTSATVKRIDDVNVLRSRQFAEDAGPMAHPIQPDSYVEINNFYTVTVYNKGAEVIRMIHTLLGEEKFRQGMDLYFERHDGEAATTEDFLSAMEDASGIDLTQFRRWYHQAGTPELEINTEYQPQDKSLVLTVKQSSPVESNQPFHIPLAVCLLDAQGNEVPESNTILSVSEAEQEFAFNNVPDNAVLSALRNYSAPVKLKVSLSDEQLAFLMARDTDEFNRWNSAQQLACNILLQLIEDYRQSKELQLPQSFIDAFKAVLNDRSLDKALAARILSLPGDDYLASLMDVIDVDGIHHVREFCKTTIADALQADFEKVYTACQSDEYSLSAEAMGQRSLRNLCLSYLLSLNTPSSRQLAMQQYQQAGNMTDKMAALRALVHTECEEKQALLADFYQQWQDDALVIDKWFTVQATAPLNNTLEQIEQLQQHKDFDLRVPNRVRALIGAFSQANMACFHDISGRGYALLTDCVLALNEINPQIAARLALPLIQWQRYDSERQALMKQQLQRIAGHEALAKDVYEIVSRGLSAE